MRRVPGVAVVVGAMGPMGSGAKWLLLAALVLASGAPIQAQLTIEEAIGIAASRHPKLAAASAAVQRERGILFQKSRKPNPIVGYTAAEVGNDGQAGQQGVFWSQTIPRGGKLPLDMEAQRWQVQAARGNMALVRCQLERRVASQYILAAAEQRRSRLLADFRDLLRQSFEQTKQLVAAQELSGATLLQVELQWKRMEVQARQAAKASYGARWKLGALLGVEAAPDTIEESVLDGPWEPMSFEETWLEVASRSPVLQVAEANHHKAIWLAQRERAEPISDVQTQLSLQHDTSTHTTVTGIQIGVEAPIHDRNRGAIAAAHSETQRTHHAIAVVKRTLRQRLLTALSQHAASLETITSQQELLELAERSRTAVRSAYNNREATTLDLLSTQRAAIDIQLETLDAQTQASLAVVAIHTALVE